jgi:hypothetical protein
MEYNRLRIHLMSAQDSDGLAVSAAKTVQPHQLSLPRSERVQLVDALMRGRARETEQMQRAAQRAVLQVQTGQTLS